MSNSQSVYRKHGVKVVIVKAKSVCNVPQQKVLLTVEIYKTDFLHDELVSESQTNPEFAASSGLVVMNNGTTRVCKYSKETHFFGIAYSKALINGRWFYAGRTRSPQIVPLVCGI